MFAFRHRLLIFAFCFFTLVFAFCVNYRFVFAFKQHRLPSLILEWCVLNVENCYAGFVKWALFIYFLFSVFHVSTFSDVVVSYFTRWLVHTFFGWYFRLIFKNLGWKINSEFCVSPAFANKNRSTHAHSFIIVIKSIVGLLSFIVFTDYCLINYNFITHWREIKQNCIALWKIEPLRFTKTQVLARDKEAPIVSTSTLHFSNK